MAASSWQGSVDKFQKKFFQRITVALTGFCISAAPKPLFFGDEQFRTAAEILCRIITAAEARIFCAGAHTSAIAAGD